MDECDSVPVNGFATAFNYDQWLWDDDTVERQAEYSLFPPVDTLCDWHPAVPKYMSYSKRLKSFDKWPEQMLPTGVQLARAGFYYTGCSDEVQCFSCGIVLRKWEERNSASSEHRRWSRFCKYMKMTHLSEGDEK